MEVVYQEYYEFGSSGWDFGLTKNVLARFDTGDLSHLTSVIDLPSRSSVAWGVALLPASRSGERIYEHIARVAGNDISNTGAWQYLNARRDWSTWESDSARPMSAVSNEYSAIPFCGQLLLVTQDTSLAFNGEIDAYISASPSGTTTTPSWSPTTSTAWTTPRHPPAISTETSPSIGHDSWMSASLDGR